MHCPSCRQSLKETDTSCAQCQFSLAALSALLGIPPQLSGPIEDVAELLTRKERQRLAQEIRRLEQRFPDIVGIAIFTSIPEIVTPELYAFWLFNRASLFSPVEQGGNNHGVLLMIDTDRPHATAMVGYGLEPFIPEQILELCLVEASHHLKTGHRAKAAAAFFHEFGQQLLQLSSAWPQAFGYSETAPWHDSTTGELVQTQPLHHGDLY